MKQINITEISNGLLVAEAGSVNPITGQPEQGKVTHCATKTEVYDVINRIFSDSK